MKCCDPTEMDGDLTDLSNKFVLVVSSTLKLFSFLIKACGCLGSGMIFGSFLLISFVELNFGHLQHDLYHCYSKQLLPV